MNKRELSFLHLKQKFALTNLVKKTLSLDRDDSKEVPEEEMPFYQLCLVWMGSLEPHLKSDH